MPSLFVFALLAANPATDDASGPPLEEVVNRGLEFISVEGPKGQPAGRCINCHHGIYTIWSQRVAAENGFSIDEAKLDQFEAALHRRFSKKAKDGPVKNNWRHSHATFFTLAKPANWNAAEDAETADYLSYAIGASQQEDGSWKASNQFNGQRRGDGEGHQIQTMWDIFALSRLEAFDKSIAAKREKAVNWVGNAPLPKATDARAMRLLFELRFGDEAKRQQVLGILTEDQNDDGSWGWMPAEEGEAWATGITLYALSFLGEDAPKEAVRSAQNYLAKTQREDGSWHVSTKGKLTKDDEIASFFGTAWSVMGLARTMERNERP